MRVLMIGGTGFMGPAVVRELLAGGHEVIVYHRGETEGGVPHGATHRHGARELLEEARPTLATLAPDVAIHMIAMTEAHAQAFVRALTGVVKRAVMISSQDVYRAYGRVIGTEPGPPDPIPLTEEAPLRDRLYPYRATTPRVPDDPRAWADTYDKILVERAVMSEPGLPCAILRLPAVYGPGDRQRRFRRFIKRMDDGRPAILLDKAEAQWRWTHGYVDDIAHAIALAALDGRSAGRIYNVGEQVAPTVEERAHMVAEAAGWHGRIILAAGDLLPEPLRAGVSTEQNLVTDTTRIRRELGYAEVTPLAEAYNRTIAWERMYPSPQDNPAEYDYAAEDRILNQQ